MGAPDTRWQIFVGAQAPMTPALPCTIESGLCVCHLIDISQSLQKYGASSMHNKCPNNSSYIVRNLIIELPNKNGQWIDYNAKVRNFPM